MHRTPTSTTTYAPESPLPPLLTTPRSALMSSSPHPRSQSKFLRWKSKLRPTLRGFLSFLYHSSFYLFISIMIILLLGSAYGLGLQAWRTGDQRKWNIIIMVGAYVALGIISISHVWSRLLSIKRIIRTMPKPYIPIKHVDLPSKVADHIMTEYSRTAVIAHISQATTGQQQGWGRPGTKWEDQHLRTYILSTLPIMRQALIPNINTTTSHSPLSLVPLFQAADSINDNGSMRLFINSYSKIIEKARYGKNEPDEADANAVDKVVELVLLTMEVKRRREKEKEKR